MDALNYEKKLKEEVVVLENTHAFCTVNRDALNSGHLMVMPKRFVKEVEELEAEEAKDFLDLCGEARKLLDSIFKHKALIAQNCKRWRSQPRLHFHILPFRVGLRHLFPFVETTSLLNFRRKKHTEEELKKMALALRQGKKP